MKCPHCGKEIIISITAPAEDLRRRWLEKGRVLVDEWMLYKRAGFSDRANLDWLDGRKTMLVMVGVDKAEALRLLKQAPGPGV